MKKLLFTILIILLCLTSFMLISCEGEEDTTTVKTSEFSITYELNGGINSVDNPLTYTKGEIVTLNNPTKDNYYFKGWYTDAAFTNKITEIKDKSENITLYAKWTPVVTYNINYELNGGTNSGDNPQNYKTGDTVSLAFPEKEYYMFAGWYTDSALTNEIKEIKDKEESLTLYAKWIPYEEVFEFYVSDGTYVVNGCKIEAETLIIPSTYKNLPVTKISNYAFCYLHSLKRIVIPDSIISIGSHSFYKCDSLESITLPSSLVSFGRAALCECFSLKNIFVDSNNQNFKSVDGILYSKDGKTLIRYPQGRKDDTFNIPNGVTTINNNAFSFSLDLKSITIPEGVTLIGDGAFFGCTSLGNIVIPDTVIQMEADAFNGCTSLKQVILSNNLEAINNHAFRNCIALKSIVIPDSIKSIGYKAFLNCNTLEEVIIGNGVTLIGQEAFMDCSSLKSIVIPDSVTTIRELAFFHCSSLTAYCEAETKPEGWNDKWFSYGTENVVWGYKGSND